MEEISKECHRIEEDALYSSKGHYNAADRWSVVHLWVNIPLVALATWAGLDIFKNDAQLAGYIAMATALLAAFNTVLNPEKRAAQHYSAAGSYNALKNDSRIFREIDLPDLDPATAKKQFKDLSKRRHDLNATSPGVPRWAFVRARTGIEEGEATYKADGENE